MKKQHLTDQIYINSGNNQGEKGKCIESANPGCGHNQLSDRDRRKKGCQDVNKIDVS